MAPLRHEHGCRAVRIFPALASSTRAGQQARSGRGGCRRAQGSPTSRPAAPEPPRAPGARTHGGRGSERPIDSRRRRPSRASLQITGAWFGGDWSWVKSTNASSVEISSFGAGDPPTPSPEDGVDQDRNRRRERSEQDPSRMADRRARRTTHCRRPRAAACGRKTPGPPRTRATSATHDRYGDPARAPYAESPSRLPSQRSATRLRRAGIPYARRRTRPRRKVKVDGSRDQFGAAHQWAIWGGRRRGRKRSRRTVPGDRDAGSCPATRRAFPKHIRPGPRLVARGTISPGEGAGRKLVASGAPSSGRSRKSRADRWTRDSPRRVGARRG